MGQRIGKNCEKDVTVESREVGEATVLCQVLPPPPFPAFTPSNPELKQPLGFLDSILYYSFERKMRVYNTF